MMKFILRRTATTAFFAFSLALANAPCFAVERVCSPAKAIRAFSLFARSSEKKPRYQTIPLRPMFVGEDGPRVRWRRSSEGVTYLRTREEREPYRVVAKEGRLFWSDGVTPVDTESAIVINSPMREPEPGNAIFVMGPTGDIYISLVQKKHEFHHSSLVAGGEIASAGEIRVRDGRVLLISDQSGHYLPEEAIFRQVITQLNRMGVQLDAAEIRVTQREVVLPSRPRAPR